MLKKLFIKNVALIERLDIEFENGFNVLTGETGAGKSIIIDAVNLVLGERASKELIKSGTQKASVEAEFQIEGCCGARTVLEKNELYEDDSLIISRELSMSGKNVCRVNGTLVNLALLKQITDFLVDVHGQNEHQLLLIQSRHIHFLDSFAHDRVSQFKNLTEKRYSEYRSIKDELLGGFTSEDQRAREADILKYQINEIEKAQLTQSEEKSLIEELAMLMNAERIMSALHVSCEALGGDNGALGAVNSASSAMKDIAGLSAEYGDAAGQLENAYYSLEDINYILRDLRSAFEFDPGRIDEIEQRLEIYSNLKKKYGPEVSDVADFMDKAVIRLEEIEGAEERRAALEAELSAASKKYMDTAAKLTEARKEGAMEMEREILRQLSDLGMEKARFSIRFEKMDEFGSNGLDRVEFLLSANPGEELKPLEKVASGGEMSRIMLAFKAITAKADSIPTLIFDEIDTGISGHIAAVVGSKMVSISDSHQVLCVTHLPQIAALADAHFIVEKEDDGVTTRTHVRRLCMDERYEYVARMMGGMDGSKLALEHARELIADSEERKKLRRSN